MKRQLIKTGITVTLPIVIPVSYTHLGYFTYSYPYSSLCITGYFHPARFHPNEPDAKRNDGSKHSR